LRNGVASPKGDVAFVLEQYASERQHTADTSWKRPANLPKSEVHFVSIDVDLESKPPKLILNCRAIIRSEAKGRAAAIVVMIADQSSARIMQVVPKSEPFVGGSPGNYRVDISAELPPLVPGFYAMDFWIGLFESVTFDWIPQAVTVEVIESPDPTSGLPYRRSNGSIVPLSKANVSKISMDN
jgi:hypothetical protein